MRIGSLQTLENNKYFSDKNFNVDAFLVYFLFCFQELENKLFFLTNRYSKPSGYLALQLTSLVMCKGGQGNRKRTFQHFLS